MPNPALVLARAIGIESGRRSLWVPDLDLALVCRLVQVEPMSEAVKQLRDAVRR